MSSIRFQVSLTKNARLSKTLMKHTRRRGIEPEVLLNAIIKAVLNDDIVDAVLDDGKGEGGK